MKNLFKGQTISLVACGLLLSTSMAFSADSIDNAFKEGKVSGDITLYGINTDRTAGYKNLGFSAATLGLSYETASYMGLSAKAGFRAGHVFGDSADLDNDALMTEAYLQYTNDMFLLRAGRQAIDLEWMGDYHEAVVAAITAVPDTSIVIGYTNQIAFADEDEISEFTQVNGDDGAYVLDVKYSGIKSVELNPYFYSAPDLANWYGLKATYSSDMFGALAHYATSSEDVAADDGSMLALEVSTSLSEISLAAGYIITDEDGGIGSMAAVGDNYEPMDDGSAIYGADAKMIYGTVGYSIAGIDLGAAYAQTKVGSLKDKELNLTAGYSFTDSLSASLLYVDINAETIDDSSYGSVLLSYTF
jgi:hypothetical protein